MKKNHANEPQQVSKKETETLLELLENTMEIDGDVVEFGCYRGDTSVLFQRSFLRHETTKRLWIYDSFAGLPAKTREDSSTAGDQFKSGELFVTKREVIEKFKRSGLRLPIIKKGFFEELNSETDVPQLISFGFLDGDLYTSIKTSLQLTVNRVADGGILVVHDYNNPELPGSARAVDEFLRTHPNVKLRRVETLAILQF